MSLKIVLAAVGLFLAAVFGLSFGKERELKKERKRAVFAEKAATKAQHERLQVQAAAELAQIDRDLAEERRRPLAARVADTYRAAKLRQGAAD